MEPPTPGFTRASRESHWINSFTSVSAFQTAAGGAAISRSWIMERRFAFAVDAVALMVELLLRTISVSCKIFCGLIPVSKPGQMAGLAPRGLRTESATSGRSRSPVHSVVTTSLRNVSRDSCCQSPAPNKRNTYLLERFGKFSLSVDRRSLHHRHVVKRSEHRGRSTGASPGHSLVLLTFATTSPSEHSAAARLPMREALSVSFFLIAHWERFEIPCLFFPGSRRHGLACRAIEHGRAAGAS